MLGLPPDGQFTVGHCFIVHLQNSPLRKVLFVPQNQLHKRQEAAEDYTVNHKFLTVKLSFPRVISNF